MPLNRDHERTADHDGRMGRRQTMDMRTVWRSGRPGRWCRNRTIDCDVAVEDLSVTGAKLAMPAHAHDTVGEVASIRIGGVWGQARIVRAVADGKDGLARWGVNFIAVEDEFLAAMGRVLVDDSPGAYGIDMRD